MRRKQPSPHFIESAHYEAAIQIMRTQPRRFLGFSPRMKRNLACYLDLKRQAERQQAAA